MEIFLSISLLLNVIFLFFLIQIIIDRKSLLKKNGILNAEVTRLNTRITIMENKGNNSDRTMQGVLEYFSQLKQKAPKKEIQKPTVPKSPSVPIDRQDSSYSDDFLTRNVIMGMNSTFCDPTFGSESCPSSSDPCCSDFGSSDSGSSDCSCDCDCGHD